MVYCPKCGNQVRNGKFCANCGHELVAESVNENQEYVENITNNNQIRQNITSNNQQEHEFNDNINQNSEFNSSVVHEQNSLQTQPTQNLQTQAYNPPNNTQFNYQQNYQQMPVEQKSKLLGFILGFFIPGLGYGYVGKWTEAIAIFIGYWVCVFLFFLILPLLIGAILWIYSLYKTNDMIDKHNRGMPY